MSTPRILDALEPDLARQIDELLASEDEGTTVILAIDSTLPPPPPSESETALTPVVARRMKLDVRNGQ